MTGRATKLRLGGMALRNGLLVHGPTHWAAAVRRDDGEIEVASGPQAAAARRPTSASRACAASLRLGEAMAVIPLVKRALPEARLPWQDATRRWRRGRRPRVGGAALRRRRRGRRRRGGDRRARRSRRRSSRCAAATSPPTTASSTRRSAPTSRTRATRATRRRSTTAAARTSWRRCSPPTSRGRRCCAASIEHPSPAANAAVQLASLGAAVEVFAWSERHAGTATARGAAPPRPRAPARAGHARADRRAARGRARRAGRDPARRAGGLTSGRARRRIRDAPGPPGTRSGEDVQQRAVHLVGGSHHLGVRRRRRSAPSRLRPSASADRGCPSRRWCHPDAAGRTARCSRSRRCAPRRRASAKRPASRRGRRRCWAGRRSCDAKYADARGRPERTSSGSAVSSTGGEVLRAHSGR